MAGRKMLREIMTINDIYNYAETIMEMLREEYGSYDADSFDEVRVDESFAQRLAARGYEVRNWSQNEATLAPSAPVRSVGSSEVVPVTVVRRGRPSVGDGRSTASAASSTRPIVPGAPPRPATSTPPAASTSAPPTAPISSPASVRPDEETPSAPRRRGRPPGSGRTTSAAASSEASPPPATPSSDGEATSAPRRRGRPPGSKNRTDS